jgi:hypothetical protein
MTIIQKTKKPMFTWIVIILALVIVGLLAGLHFFGIIDLSFLAVWFLGLFMWASVDIVNGLIVTTGIFLLGAATYYIAVKYFIGQKITSPLNTYTPQGQTISQPQQSNSETVVS